MELKDLVKALLAFATLTARQWLADAGRSDLVWAKLPAPTGLDATELATAAGVTELLASRRNSLLLLPVFFGINAFQAFIGFIVEFFERTSQILQVVLEMEKDFGVQLC